MSSFSRESTYEAPVHNNSESKLEGLQKFNKSSVLTVAGLAGFDIFVLLFFFRRRLHPLTVEARVPFVVLLPFEAS